MPLPSRSPFPAPAPPYALAPIAFRFPALAALAGRAPLGGQREVVLAAYLVARLADDARPERDISQPLRTVRAAHAKTWLASVALPAPVRSALVRIADATVEHPAAVARSLREELGALAPYMDIRAQAELDALLDALDTSAQGPAQPQALVE